MSLRFLISPQFWWGALINWCALMLTVYVLDTYWPGVAFALVFGAYMRHRYERARELRG